MGGAASVRYLAGITKFEEFGALGVFIVVVIVLAIAYLFAEDRYKRLITWRRNLDGTPVGGTFKRKK